MSASFELLDAYGQLIAYEDVYFEIGDSLIHIENASDYMLRGYDIETYDMSDEELIDFIEREGYGKKHTRRF